VLDFGLLVLVELNLKESRAWIEMMRRYLVKSGSIESNSGSSADDLSGEAKIFKDLVVDVGEGSAEWSLLLLVSGLSSGLGKDSSLGENDDVLARELLLEFSDDLLVDLLPGLDLWEGNEKDDGLSAGSNLEFLGGLQNLVINPCSEKTSSTHLEVKLLQDGLKVGSGVVLDLDESGGKLLLAIGGLLASILENLGSCGVSHIVSSRLRV
jgi:hypothetical protein